VNQTVKESLAELFQTALKNSGEGGFSTLFDSEWRSDCEVRQEGDRTYWQPALQETSVDFSGLANAVGQPIHPDICAYYGSYWAGTLEATSQEGHVSLIQLWNQEDFDRLIANLIGHLMAKQRLKKPFTVFFANTDPDTELFLSIDNDSGNVLLEEPGKPDVRVVDKDIVTFLNRLSPVVGDPGIY
jgi:SecY interacting protein Syd